MTIFDVVVNTDDLVVLGPPDVIDLSVSIGQQGQRGATFYAGAGNPNDALISENIFGNNVVPISGDIFVNTSLGPQYGWLYIYNPKIVGDQWDQVLKLQQPFYAKSQDAEFLSGAYTISIPLTEIIPSGSPESDPDKYIINITAKSSNPTVVTVESKTIVADNLEVALSGIEYSSSSWSDLNETISIYIHVAVV